MAFPRSFFGQGTLPYSLTEGVRFSFFFFFNVFALNEPHVFTLHVQFGTRGFFKKDSVGGWLNGQKLTIFRLPAAPAYGIVEMVKMRARNAQKCT